VPFEETMAKRLWWIGGVGLALALVLPFLWRVLFTPVHVDAPEPVITADFPDSLPQIPPSVLIAPIVFDLGPAITQFESDIPRRFGSLDQRLRADSSARASVAFAATRSPFQVHVEGREIVVETVLEYEGRGWYDPPLGPEVSAGCGGGEDPKPRLRMRIISTPSLTAEWDLLMHTRAEVARFSDSPRDQCQVTFLKIDVTGKVVSAVGEEMTRKVERLDRHVERQDTRGQIERIWRRIERPIRLTEGVWLLLQPGAAQLASLSGGGDSLVAVVRLEARPKIVTGMRPEDSTLVTPLPPLQTAAAADTGGELHVVIEGIFSYDAATGLMRKALVGKVIRMGWRFARIEDTTLQGIGSGRVALGVKLSGAVQGRVFLTGTPQLNLASRQLTVPDLEFDAGSTDLPAGGHWWLYGDAMRNFLRAKAAIPDTAALAGMQRRAIDGMNRKLAAGVRLEATLSDSRGMAVCATREHLVVRALAEGQARLVVERVLGRARRRPGSSARP
jgi:hypothetical protein